MVKRQRYYSNRTNYGLYIQYTASQPNIFIQITGTKNLRSEENTRKPQANDQKATIVPVYMYMYKIIVWCGRAPTLFKMWI